MQITCPHCAALGSGPRFVMRHFVEELCKQKEKDREFNRKLAEGTRCVDEEEGMTPERETALRALRKKS